MKIRLMLVFALIPAISFAQRDAVPYQVIQTKTNLLTNEKTGDTEVIYPGNWLNIDSVIIYTVIDNGGFVVGTNVYGDLAKAQRFTIDKPGHIIGARYWIGLRDGDEGSLAFNIWSFNGSPGEVLASRVVPANQVGANLLYSQAHYVEFHEPVPVDGDFVVGFDMSGIGNTQVALVSSWDGEAGDLGLSWEKWSDGKWYPFLDSDGWDMDIDLAIFPVIMWDSEDPDPDPDPDAITGIQVLQRADGSGLVDVGYNLSGKYDEYFVDLALSLDGGNTFFPVNPADVSGDFWPVSPGENKQLVFDARRVSPDASTSQARVMLSTRTGLIVTTTKVGHITFSTATMGGEVLADGGLEVTGRGIVFGTEPEPAISNPTTISLGAGLGSFNDYITGLLPNTTYYVRAWATSSQGTAYGNQEVFSTTEEGPIVIHGPGGSVFTLPAEAIDDVPGLTLHEHPEADILLVDEIAASPVIRIGSERNYFIHQGEDYLISLPVSIPAADPDLLRVNVRLEGGVIMPVFGEYDPQTNTYHVQTIGLAKDWVVGVVVGDPVIREESTEKIWTWPSTQSAIVVASNPTPPQQFSRQAIVNHLMPMINDVLEKLMEAGFAAPNLLRRTSGSYEYIFTHNGTLSYYEPPSQPLLGRIYIKYDTYVSDYDNPVHAGLRNLVMHETFHAVQWAYDFRPHADQSQYHQSRMNASSAYLEGTASLAGANYAIHGHLSPGRVYVDTYHQIEAHDLGYPADDFQHSDAYSKQDFFAFIGKKTFQEDIRFMNTLWLAFKNPAASKTQNQTTSNYLLQFRKDLNDYLMLAGTTLPEVYTEYALQRLYLHQSQYLLRDTEIAENSGTQKFATNRLSKHLLEKSKRHTDWKSSRNDTLHFLPIKFEDLKPLSSAAATLTIPTGTDPQDIPDTLTFNFSLSGNAKINQNMREEGIRILIIRAKDQHGIPVASNPIMYVTDLDDPVNVPLSGGVSHLVFLAINGYVEETVTTINIETTEQDLKCPPEGILIGKLCWMGENLDVDVGTNSYFKKSYTINDSTLLYTHTEYGRLYDWATALIACPTGWRLPSKKDWDDLINYLGGVAVAGGKLKSNQTIEKGVGEPHNHPGWYAPNVGATNEIGFSALPGGSVIGDGLLGLAVFMGLGNFGLFWTSDDYTWSDPDKNAWVYVISNNSAYVTRSNGDKRYGHSVRCVRDVD